MKKRTDPLFEALERKQLKPKLAEAASKPMAAQLAALEEALMAKRFPAMSPWWHETLQRFYESGRRQLVLRCGRRGGKSTTLCRVAVLEALYGDHKIPPGDTGTVGIVSVTMDEARQRLKTIRDILNAIGVPFRDTKDVLELRDRPIKFHVYAASFKAVVGGTWICAICDEVSRWRDAESGANPAFEVLASLRPTMATMPHARLFLSSSPLGLTDAHAKAFEDGDNEYQIVVHAPTWVANPTVTEADTHLLERNERVWKREYAALPQGALTAVFNIEDIDNSINLGEHLVIEAVSQPIMCIDPSRGHDAWTYCIAQWVWNDGRACLRIPEVGEVADAGDTRRSLDWLVTKARANNCVVVGSDQYDASGLAVMFSERNLSYYVNTWSARTKKEAVDRLDMMLRDGDISLPSHDLMRRQLIEYSEKIGRNGGDPSYSGRGAHDDFAAVILTAIMMDLGKKIPPVRPPTKPIAATKQIEDRWFEQQYRRHEQQKQLDRDMGAGSWETYFENLEYMP